MIIFFYGEDSFRSQQKVVQVKERFTKEVDTTGQAITTNDAKELSADDLARLMASGGGFFSEKKLIIVKNIFDCKKPQKEAFKEVLKPLVESKEPEDNTLLIWQQGTADKREALFKLLKKAPFIHEFTPLEGYQLSSWVKNAIQEQGVDSDPQAQQLLESFVGRNLWQMQQEIKKISSFVLSEKRTFIETEDVKKLVEAGFNDDIFGLMDALSTKSTTTAIQLLQDQWRAGKDALYLLGMLVRQFRILSLVKHRTHLTPASANQLAKELQLHPFVVQKATEQSKNFSWDQITTTYHSLVEADRLVKTTALKGEDILFHVVSQLILS